MMSRSAVLALSTLLAAGTVALTADAKLSSVGKGQVNFLAIGPAGLKINGHGSGLKASEEGGKLVVTAPVNNLKTGIGLRDDHLKNKYLKVHTPAKLVVDKDKLKFPEDNKTVEGGTHGEFTLAGKTKKIPFSYKVKRTGSDYHVQGRATINIKDYGIEQPCYLGVCVDEEVKIAVKFKLRDS